MQNNHHVREHFEGPGRPRRSIVLIEPHVCRDEISLYITCGSACPHDIIGSDEWLVVSPTANTFAVIYGFKPVEGAIPELSNKRDLRIHDLCDHIGAPSSGVVIRRRGPHKVVHSKNASPDLLIDDILGPRVEYAASQGYPLFYSTSRWGIIRMYIDHYLARSWDGPEQPIISSFGPLRHVMIWSDGVNITDQHYSVVGAIVFRCGATFTGENTIPGNVLSVPFHDADLSGFADWAHTYIYPKKYTTLLPVGKLLKLGPGTDMINVYARLDAYLRDYARTS